MMKKRMANVLLKATVAKARGDVVGTSGFKCTIASPTIVLRYF
jgi:hypothetical protein